MNAPNDMKGLTENLLHTIGSPFESKSKQDDICESENVFTYANRNKIGFYYLETLRQAGKLNKLKDIYEKEYIRVQNQRKAITRLASILNPANIEYTLFKTIKPFPSYGKDADVMIMGNMDQYKSAIWLLVRAGYLPCLPDIINGIDINQVENYSKTVNVLSSPTYGVGHISVTGTDLIDPVNDVDIDLQVDFGTSYLIWMNKSIWKDYIYKVDLNNNNDLTVHTLRPEMDMVITVAHNAMEQATFIGDYYSFMTQLTSINDAGLKCFINEIKRNRLVKASQAFLSIITTLHEDIHGFIPDKLSFLSNELGRNLNESSRLIKNNYCMKHVYSWNTFTGIMAEKLGDAGFSHSVFNQVIHMVNPKLTMQVIREIGTRSKVT